ncbi:hypothetical protein GCK72_025109 [Caenorhabditis remanei]|uniref:Uncharacterized protein n=1 Tax=Caenorhabditis remanei TaxID=31234 RepID=A0A6A5G1U7_CAERE|nr:hypothetical protein GCK72_025109 [Caenorhabditis remanei]KAF1748642.1 hypothetical protein GCK72_025109 [Caenorhabditis remanei]
MTNSSNIVFRLRVDLESLREKAVNCFFKDPKNPQGSEVKRNNLISLILRKIQDEFKSNTQESEEPKIREKMKAWDFILDRITRKTDLVPALIEAGLNLEQKIVDFPNF